MTTPATLARVVAAVSASEGGYTSVNANSDDQGVSWGIIQWSQRSGSLGQVLSACRAANASLFDSIMGGPTVVTQTTSSSESTRMAAVGGVSLWSEPWVSRFQRLGAQAAFQTVQLQVAAAGDHMRNAQSAFAELGEVRTERMLALVYDTSVNQGSGALKTVLGRFLRSWTHPVDYWLVLELWAQAAASRYRSREPNGSWVLADDGWYYKIQFKRRVYDRVLERQRKIVASAALTDGMVV